MKNNVGPLTDDTEELTQVSRTVGGTTNKHFAFVFMIKNTGKSIHSPVPPRGMEPMEIL